MPKPRKSRYKHVCKNCGLPITLVTKKQKPNSYKEFKGEWVHALKGESGNYYFMCDSYNPEVSGYADPA